MFVWRLIFVLNILKLQECASSIMVSVSNVVGNVCHPGPLVLPPNLTERNVDHRRTAHKKALALFHETVHLENALKNKYVNQLMNST